METPVRLGYVGDGANYHVRKWLPALVDAGIQVVLFTFDMPDEPLPGVKVIELKRRRRGKVRYLDYFQPAAQLSHRIEEERCNLVMGSYATHYGWLAARTGFKPLVMQTWTGDLTVYPFKGVRRIFFGPIVRYGLRRADLITTDGKALLKQGQQLYPEYAHRMIATRWGISTSRSSGLTRDKAAFAQSAGLDSLEGYTVVVAPRGLQHWYQPELVIETLLTAVERDTQIFAVMLTMGHQRDPNMDALLRTLDHHPRALVVDRFLDTEEMDALWSAADLVLSIPYSDGISESVLEAIHAGALPILSDIPSNRSLVEDGVQASLVDTDIESVVAAIVAAAHLDHPQAAEMRRHNRDWIVRNATVEATAAELASVLRGIVRASEP